jgi:hypothetical protein
VRAVAARSRRRSRRSRRRARKRRRISPRRQPPPRRSWDSPEDAALLAAAEAYTRKHAAAGLEFTLRIQAQEGDFALLVVEPKKEEADAALLFMKREGGGWKGLDLGTGIDCSDSWQGVPVAARHRATVSRGGSQ